MTSLNLLSECSRTVCRYDYEKFQGVLRSELETDRVVVQSGNKQINKQAVRRTISHSTDRFA